VGGWLVRLVQPRHHRRPFTWPGSHPITYRTRRPSTRRAGARHPRGLHPRARRLSIDTVVSYRLAGVRLRAAGVPYGAACHPQHGWPHSCSPEVQLGVPPASRRNGNPP